jgi:hypothetical protein
MKLLILFLLLILNGCRSIPQDMSPAPINNNKMTLELHACGTQEVGLSGCFYKNNLEEKLAIPLWSTGEYQIKSERCNFFKNKRYDKSQTLELTYQELLSQKPEKEDGCLYNIKVFIDGFDNGLEGFFILAKGDIKALGFEFDKKSYNGYAGLQIKEGTLLSQDFIIKAETPGLVVWEGCQKKGEREYSSNPKINFQEIIEGYPIPKASCILTLGIIPYDIRLPVEYGKIHINIYEKTVQPLVEPSIKYENGRLTVKSEKVVAGIGINSSWSIKRGSAIKKLTAVVQEDTEADVRIVTSNGRFMLLKVKNGEVLWVK